MTFTWLFIEIHFSDPVNGPDGHVSKNNSSPAMTLSKEEKMLLLWIKSGRILTKESMKQLQNRVMKSKNKKKKIGARVIASNRAFALHMAGPGQTSI